MVGRVLYYFVLEQERIPGGGRGCSIGENLDGFSTGRGLWNFPYLRDSCMHCVFVYLAALG